MESKQWHHPKAQTYQVRMKRRPTRGERRFDDILDMALVEFDLPLIKQTQAKKSWHDRKKRKFKKQKIFENQTLKKAYIVDFYIPSLKLAFEVDGPDHAKSNKAVYDIKRTAYLSTRGVKVIRFKNDDTKLPDGCIDTIKQAISLRIKELGTSLTAWYGKQLSYESFRM